MLRYTFSFPPMTARSRRSRHHVHPVCAITSIHPGFASTSNHPGCASTSNHPSCASFSSHLGSPHRSHYLKIGLILSLTTAFSGCLGTIPPADNPSNTILYSADANSVGSRSVSQPASNPSSNHLPDTKTLALPSTRFAQAEKHYRNGEHIRAETLLQALVADYPELAQAWYYLGNLAFHQSDRQRAKTYWLKALEKNPRHWEAQYNLSMLNLNEAHERMVASLRDGVVGQKREQMIRQKDWLERLPR